MAKGEKSSNGAVVAHLGQDGELIVSRDSVIYWLSTGDRLFEEDIVRAQQPNKSTIVFNGCVRTLPEKEDVLLDSGFCSLASLDGPSLAAIASEGGAVSELGSSSITQASPLVVGATTLSAAGLIEALDGGSGGTGSVASEEAGVASATASSP